MTYLLKVVTYLFICCNYEFFGKLKSALEALQGKSNLGGLTGWGQTSRGWHKETD